MKNIKKLFIITIIILSIMFLGTTKNFAVEDTNNEATNTAINTTTNTTNSSNITATQNTVSPSSTILTSLGIRPYEYDFKGFKNATTTYEAKVPKNVETVEVYATTQNPKATLEGTGTITLKEGSNIAEVTVIAEDGTRKTFTINILRGEETNAEQATTTTTEENQNTETADIQTSAEGLSVLSIKDVSLSPQFQTNIYEYTAKYIGEATRIRNYSTGKQRRIQC